jgi:hypothetical protein
MEINLALSRLGLHPEPKDTPSDRAESLTTILPSAKHPTNTLLIEYQVATYSSKGSVDIQTARKAGNEIRWLSFKELYNRVMDRLAPRKS